MGKELQGAKGGYSLTGLGEIRSTAPDVEKHCICALGHIVRTDQVAFINITA